MDDVDIISKRIAHHEAAHSVMAILYGAGLSGGIDLTAPTSVPGSFGVSAVSLFEPDPSLSEAEQQLEVVRSLVIICAGAASDAKLEGLTLQQAIAGQPGDLGVAQEHAKLHPIVSDGEIDYVIDIALSRAAQVLDRAEVWDAVEAVASAALANDGKLDRIAIEELASHLLAPADPDSSHGTDITIVCGKVIE
jgi:hypothetical protein